MGTENMDRRVRKTKKQLRECLTRLLKEKKVKDITVRELTDMADLNRGTFYLHYRDVFDLLEKTENELLDEFNQLMHRHNALEINDKLDVIFVEIFHLVQDNAALVEILLGENGDLNFVNRLKLLVREKCLQDWMELFRSANSAFFEAYYSFIVSGCVGLVQYWLQNGMAESPEELALLAEHIITQGIHVLENG